RADARLAAKCDELSSFHRDGVRRNVEIDRVAALLVLDPAYPFRERSGEPVEVGVDDAVAVDEPQVDGLAVAPGGAAQARHVPVEAGIYGLADAAGPQIDPRLEAAFSTFAEARRKLPRQVQGPAVRFLLGRQDRNQRHPDHDQSPCESD